MSQLKFHRVCCFYFGSQQVQQLFLLRNIRRCLRASPLASWLSRVLADEPVHVAGASAPQVTVWSECRLHTSMYLFSSAFPVSEVVFSVILDGSQLVPPLPYHCVSWAHRMLSVFTTLNSSSLLWAVPAVFSL